MNLRRNSLAALWLTAACGLIACTSPPLEAAPEASVRGVVFHDRNGNGQRDRFEAGISGVAVSNGHEVARTDWRGRYRLPITADTGLFVVKPSGYVTPLDANQRPRFYTLHKPSGSPPGLGYAGVAPTGPLPDSLDFPLYRSSEPARFEVLLFGDTQPYTIAEVDTLAHDIVEGSMDSGAAFGIVLGDIVGDDLDLFEPVARTLGKIGIPWYYVPGNHDLNFLADDDLHSDETFERVFGPGTYAFEYASAHFIVLDDVIFGGPLDAGGSASQNYVGGLHADQIAFVRNYLAGVPSDHLVVLAMHIPLVGETETLGVAERGDLLAALANHANSFSISAHRHTQRHLFLDAEAGWEGSTPHHHLVQGTTSGSWWLGEPDELGIPHAMMRDGTPNGHSILRIDGNRYSLRYQVARRPASYQMNVFAPEAIPAARAAETEVLVNVFFGSERSRVEMRLEPGAAWIPLERSVRADPYYEAIKRREAEQVPPPTRRLPPIEPSPHLWAGTLPANPAPGTYALEVRTTDMFGETFTTHRFLRIE